MILCLTISITYAQASSMTAQMVMIQGTQQSIYITGQKANHPVLLILHGGPGFAMLPLFHEKLPELEKTFTVVNWDQRGAGRSYAPSIPRRSMTLNQFVEDAHELTQLLKKQFHQDRIFLLGHSSGTMIGVLLAKRYPEDYAAYIGVGQVVNFAENEIDSYDFALARASQTHHAQAEKQLKAIGRPDKQGHYRSDKGYDITAHWVEYFGGSLLNQSSLDKVYDLIFSHPIYEGYEQNILKGYEFSQALFDDDQMRQFNLLRDIQELNIPVYILSGQNDFETPVTVIRKYFDQINVPYKKYIEFSKSAHFPFYEEPKRFVAVMNEILTNSSV